MNDQRMPVLFVGHGSPMNAIEDNEFSREWRRLGRELPRPKTILVISAHWLTDGTWITALEKPRTIHDFTGFPKALFDVQYPAPGDPKLAAEIADRINMVDIGLDSRWGLDHGSWSVLLQMYPEADIPVLQLSIDLHQTHTFHVKLGQQLSFLRDHGVLILGSGNIVHNLRLTNEEDIAADWAIEFDEQIKNLLDRRRDDQLIHYSQLSHAKLAVPTPDHYIPLLYCLGATDTNESLRYFNDKVTMNSLSMRTMVIG